MRKNFFSEGAVRQWHRLPREAVQSLSLEVLKNHVDVEREGLGQWAQWGGLVVGLGDLRGLF